MAAYPISRVSDWKMKICRGIDNEVLESGKRGVCDLERWGLGIGRDLNYVMTCFLCDIH